MAMDMIKPRVIGEHQHELQIDFHVHHVVQEWELS